MCQNLITRVLKESATHPRKHFMPKTSAKEDERKSAEDELWLCTEKSFPQLTRDKTAPINKKSEMGKTKNTEVKTNNGRETTEPKKNGEGLGVPSKVTTGTTPVFTPPVDLEIASTTAVFVTKEKNSVLPIPSPIKLHETVASACENPAAFTNLSHPESVFNSEPVLHEKPEKSEKHEELVNTKTTVLEKKETRVTHTSHASTEKPKTAKAAKVTVDKTEERNLQGNSTGKSVVGMMPQNGVGKSQKIKKNKNSSSSQTYLDELLSSQKKLIGKLTTQLDESEGVLRGVKESSKVKEREWNQREKTMREDMRDIENEVKFLRGRLNDMIGERGEREMEKDARLLAIEGRERKLDLVLERLSKLESATIGNSTHGASVMTTPRLGSTPTPIPTDGVNPVNTENTGDEDLLTTTINNVRALEKLTDTLQSEWFESRDKKILEFLISQKAELETAKKLADDLKMKGRSVTPSVGKSSMMGATPGNLQIGDLRTTLTHTGPPIGGPKASTSNPSGSYSQGVGLGKFANMVPPVGFVGIHRDAKLQNHVTTMDLYTYLGTDTGLDRWFHTVKNTQPGGILSVDLHKRMILLTEETWETQRREYLKNFPNGPKHFEIQTLSALRGLRGLKRFSEMDYFDSEFLTALRSEYVTPEGVRVMIQSLATMRQNHTDILEHVGNYTCAVYRLESIAPGKLSEGEKLDYFLQSLADDYTRRSIYGKTGITSLGQALDAITIDLRDCKRKAQEGYDNFERDKSNHGSEHGRLDTSHAHKTQKVKSAPMGRNPEYEKVNQTYHFRLTKGLCTRCGANDHRVYSRPGYNDPTCPLSKDDKSRKYPSQAEIALGFSEKADYVTAYAVQRSAKTQGVAENSRLQKNSSTEAS